ncbi:MAG: RidA family protein [Calothrix sp. MO_167.B42]|nr:RidA family protein [Calothrix sp. MO_167.B42]
MSNTREVIIPQGMEILYEKFHYCPGIKVGNTLYISGQVGRDENFQIIEGTEAQFIQAFENVQKVLSAAGATFDNVVEMITYHVTEFSHTSEPEQRKIPHLPLFMQVKDRYFINQFPTWTGVGVTALSTPGLIVEIKCTAILEN